MADLLLRNVPDYVKQELERLASMNNRSQSAEVLSILEDNFRDDQNSWLLSLALTAQSVGGIELKAAPKPVKMSSAKSFFGDVK